jgi:hypothetical protein
MKFKSVSLTLGLLVFGAVAAHAGSFWYGGDAGMSFPTGDYSNAASTGWHLGGTGTYMVNDRWGWGGDLAYHAWNGSDQLNTATEAVYGPGSSFKWTALQTTAHGMYRFSTMSSAKPFATFGMGLYSVTGKLDSPSGNAHTSETDLGFNFGGGVDFLTTGNMSWGLSGTYHMIPTGNDVGTDINAFALGAHMMWGMTTHETTRTR